MIDDQNGIGRARRYSIIYGNERLMRAFPAFYLLAAYPPWPIHWCKPGGSRISLLSDFPTGGERCQGGQRTIVGKALPFRLSRKKLLWSAEYPIVQEDDRRG
jgi:hypothetical protein